MTIFLKTRGRRNQHWCEDVVIAPEGEIRFSGTLFVYLQVMARIWTDILLPAAIAGAVAAQTLGVEIHRASRLHAWFPQAARDTVQVDTVKIRPDSLKSKQDSLKARLESLTLLGQIPLVQSVREGGDEGHPAALEDGPVFEAMKTAVSTLVDG